MKYWAEFDPQTVLGLAPGASPQEVRDAFHEKSKKYHPDRGGDEWAFRVVARAYELLKSGPEPAEDIPPVAPAGEPTAPRCWSVAGGVPFAAGAGPWPEAAAWIGPVRRSRRGRSRGALLAGVASLVAVLVIVVVFAASVLGRVPLIRAFGLNEGYEVATITRYDLLGRPYEEAVAFTQMSRGDESGEYEMTVDARVVEKFAAKVTLAVSTLGIAVTGLGMLILGRSRADATTRTASLARSILKAGLAALAFLNVAAWAFFLLLLYATSG